MSLVLPRASQHTDCRAFLTCKGDAFAGPRCLLDPNYYLGSNELTTWELSLVAAYEDLGRSDLAECVRQGKKFQRLRDFIEFDNQDIEHLHALYRAFVEPFVGPIGPEPQSVTEWANIATRHFPDLAISDTDLAMLVHRAALATPLPDTELPADSDSDDEEGSRLVSSSDTEEDDITDSHLSDQSYSTAAFV